MAETERKSRIDEDRESQSREVQARKDEIYKNLRMGYRGKLHIDPSDIPDGIDYIWVRHLVFGDPSWSRMAEMAGKGWTLVPPSRHPFLGSIDPTGRGAEAQPYIMIGGSILCQRPKEFGEEEQRLDAEYQIQQMTANPAMTNMMSNPSIPVQVWANQTTNSRSFRNE